ncbi:magnesium transporter [Hyphobacterium sp. HN65]|uniref:Magnesium transporter MgtE n=1 Tax=Hyphobacterium lacteum TaxID=3116575 RepID=A0ABU7LMN9_9PROT|nr:magnesium transporter [Hyphobacterium sp. HN65]MEE2525169.1 magnesium transporter [Hyphobacterium sp. HN65]
MSEIAPEIEIEETASAAETDIAAVGRLAAAIADRDGLAIRGLLDECHPADAADILEQLSKEQVSQAAKLAPEAFTGELLSELQWDLRDDITEVLEPQQIAEAIRDLDSDDAALVLEELDDDVREAVLSEVSDEDRTLLESHFEHEEETAGRLMQRDFVAAPEHWTVGDTIDHMRAAGEDLPDVFFDIYVVNAAFAPMGAVAVSQLMRSKRDARLSDLMSDLRVTIEPDVDQEEAAYLFEKYHLFSAPVIDEAGRLTGMLTIDDMVDVIQEENKEDMLALAGVNDAGLSDSVIDSVRSRAPWLLVNLATAILASGVIAIFEDALAAVVALAVLMPIVASMGGNAGTQSLAVAVRAIASRDLTSANARRVIIREILTGLVNGVIFAVVMALVAALWFQNWTLAGVIGLAMVINLAFAGLAGIAVPLALRRFGADPAVSSSVFVTTVTDVIGFFAFLGLAAIILL